MGISIYFYLALSIFPEVVWSHARLISPPSRSSMWRLGYPTPVNFNDNELYCGGISTQWQKNKGKCGICGDPYNMPHPRPNEAGGRYGRGIITKRYISGQVIDATVDVTTNHRGYFEFKLCPNNNPKKPATQECLDKYVLREAFSSGTRYYIGDKGKGDITVKLQLPKGLTCSQCVFQWTYVAGNNWGKCKDGASGLGCGPQETFRGCADIAIHKDYDTLNYYANEIDVEYKLHEIQRPKSSVLPNTPNKNVPLNKNVEQNKNTTETKHFVYAYEISKHTRLNTSKSFSGGNDVLPNVNRTELRNSHSHQDEKEVKSDENGNSHFHYDNELHHKIGDFYPLSPKQPKNSTKKTSHSNEPRHHGSTNRRRHKYDNRHFYHHKRNPSFRQNPFDKKWELSMNNSKWPISVTGLDLKSSSQGRKKDAQKSRNRFPQRRHFTASSESVDDSDLSAEGFYLGGKRYKDFWFL